VARVIVRSTLEDAETEGVALMVDEALLEGVTDTGVGNEGVGSEGGATVCGRMGPSPGCVLELRVCIQMLGFEKIGVENELLQDVGAAAEATSKGVCIGKTLTFGKTFSKLLGGW
jgi:hypothetical protein